MNYKIVGLSVGKMSNVIQQLMSNGLIKGSPEIKVKGSDVVGFIRTECPRKLIESFKEVVGKFDNNCIFNCKLIRNGVTVSEYIANINSNHLLDALRYSYPVSMKETPLPSNPLGAIVENKLKGFWASEKFIKDSKEFTKDIVNSQLKEAKEKLSKAIEKLEKKTEGLKSLLKISDLAEALIKESKDEPYSNVGKRMFPPEHENYDDFEETFQEGDSADVENNNFDLLPTKGKATAIYNLMDLIRQQYEINKNEKFERGADLYYVGLVSGVEGFRAAVAIDSVGKEIGLYNGMIFKFTSEINARRFRDENYDKLMSLKSIGLFKTR